MNPTGYTVEITNLSPNATEKDVYDFFAFCGAIQHVEIVRYSSHSRTAMLCIVFFNLSRPFSMGWGICMYSLRDFQKSSCCGDSYPVNGATILDRPVCITRSGHYGGDYNLWNHSSLKTEDENLPSWLLKDMLGKGALNKAKAFDESHQDHISNTTRSVVSATGKRAASAANAVANSGYFSKGALWLSGALSRASQVAADLAVAVLANRN
ncbi:hypothetical protein Sango_1084400 [Sesamum angolense]|uniref:RRM domain-containing protein n=1 Tax=Sesamum angolense TaxID=2727404 RepID=A0AAE2BW22_9LAMI|nr:hypothetical protein Sango_1084400 [Sesamum angolense]